MSSPASSPEKATVCSLIVVLNVNVFFDDLAFGDWRALLAPGKRPGERLALGGDVEDDGGSALRLSLPLAGERGLSVRENGDDEEYRGDRKEFFHRVQPRDRQFSI